MSKQARIEIARAVLRLTQEPLVPVAVLADATRMDPRALVRWITQGRGGVYLDGLHRPGVGWVTSVAAWKRFREKLHARKSPKPQSRTEEI